MSSRITNLIVLTVVVGLSILTGLIVLGGIYSNLKQQAYRKQHEIEQAQLFSNPEAVRFREENSEECAPKDVEYYWICGALVKAKPTLPYGYCSTLERPLFYGALAGEDDPLFGDLKFGHPIVYGKTSISPYYSKIYRRVSAPDVDEISDTLVFPNARSGYASAWVRYGNTAVLFHKRGVDWKVSAEAASKMPVSVSLRHPEYPLHLSGHIPIEDIDDWRDYIADFIQEGTASVLSFENSADCRRPPAHVKYRFNSYGTTIRSLVEWNEKQQDFVSQE